MKSLFVLIAFIFSLMLNAQQSYKEDLCKGIHEFEKETWLRARPSLASAALNNYDISYHRCYWEIDPAVKFIKGNILSFFKPTTSGFNAIEFDLSKALTVDSVVYHSTAVSYTHQAGDILRITLPALLPENLLDSIRVYYQGVPDENGFGSFVQATHDGVPVLWTLSEPFGAKTWWPCKQNLADKIDSIDIHVKTPQQYRVASNGLLISELPMSGDKIYHWRSRYPIAPYLVAIAVSNYVDFTDYVPLQTNTLQVLNYVYPEGLASAQASTADMIKIIKLFDSLLIEYPFVKEKYGHAQFSRGGGMEHQTMSFMGGFSLSLMAHEYAHHWFGDLVTCGSWEDIWLNEGLASYFEWLVTERYENAGWIFGLPEVVKYITSQPDGAVRCNDTNEVSRIFDARLSYSKGAFVFRMLRWKIGDEAFFKALKNYLNDPLLKNSYAKTPQLKAHFEVASGQNLNQFFNEWYSGEGYPSYEVNWRQANDMVTVTLTQKQSHASVSFFEMPVPLRLEGNGKDSIVVFDNTFSGETMQFNPGFKVEAVRFDPNYQLLSANNKVSGFNEADLETAPVILYPNPAGENIQISGVPNGTVQKKLSISNLLGQVVYSDEVSHNVNGDISLSTSRLVNGWYILSLHTSIGKTHIHFLKQ